MSYKSFLYILKTRAFSDIWFVNIFFQHMVYFFNLLLVFFNIKTFSFSWSPVFLFFSLVVCALGVSLRNLLLNPKSWRFSPMFSSKNVIILALTFKSSIHFGLILYIMWDRVQLHSFEVEIQWSQHLLLESLFFCPLNNLAPLSKSSDRKCIGLPLGSLFCPIDLCVHPMLAPHLLHYCSFMARTGPLKLQLFDFFKIVWTIMSFLNFLMNLRISLSVSAKKGNLDLNKDCVESVDIN